MTFLRKVVVEPKLRSIQAFALRVRVVATGLTVDAQVAQLWRDSNGSWSLLQRRGKSACHVGLQHIALQCHQCAHGIGHNTRTRALQQRRGHGSDTRAALTRAQRRIGCAQTLQKVFAMQFGLASLEHQTGKPQRRRHVVARQIK